MSRHKELTEKLQSLKKDYRMSESKQERKAIYKSIVKICKELKKADKASQVFTTPGGNYNPSYSIAKKIKEIGSKYF